MLKPLLPSLPILALLGLAAGCNDPASHYPGYVEGEYLHMAVPAPGRLLKADLRRGDTVKAGELLFEVEREQERARLDETEHRLARARANYNNLTKGKRPEEIEVIQQQLAQARADAELAAKRLRRSRELFKSESISRDDLDAARSRQASAQSRVRELQASLASAELAARSDELDAAQQAVKAAQAAVAQARWAYEQKAPTAPADALVQDRFFQPGEWVPAGTPVISLLPAENRLVRFFVSEDQLAGLHTGDSVQLHCDACGAAITAHIDFIAAEAEYTPPVIYSQDQRARLVFRIEARPTPADARRLPPGLPVDVRLPQG